MTSWGEVTWQKIKFFRQILFFLLWSQNFFCFALALTVSKISLFFAKLPNQHFFKVTWPFFENNKMILIFSKKIKLVGLSTKKLKWFWLLVNKINWFTIWPYLHLRNLKKIDGRAKQIILLVAKQKKNDLLQSRKK